MDNSGRPSTGRAGPRGKPALLADNACVTRAKPPHESTPFGRLDEGPLNRILGYQLAQANVAAGEVFAGQVGDVFELRPVEFTVLALVHQNPGLTPGQLATALSVTPSNITMWIDRLHKRGWVDRELNVKDRRSQHLHVTAEGAEIARQATERLFEGEHQALSALSPGERMLLIELLHKMARCRSR